MLALLNAALLTDLIVIFLSFSALKTPALTLWYKEFGIGAVIADVLILVLGVILANFIYPLLFSKYNFLYFICLVLIVQLAHDLLFGFFVNQYKGASPIFRVFKQYVKEIGFRILLVDACMILSTVLLHRLFSKSSHNDIWAVLLCYITPYLVFSV